MRLAAIFAALALCATSSLAAPGPSGHSGVRAALSDIEKREAVAGFNPLNERAVRLNNEKRGDVETDQAGERTVRLSNEKRGDVETDQAGDRAVRLNNEKRGDVETDQAGDRAVRLNNEKRGDVETD